MNKTITIPVWLWTMVNAVLVLSVIVDIVRIVNG